MTRHLQRLAERAHVLRQLPGPCPSPCLSVCTMDAQRGLCSGCLRTLDEIAHWSQLDDTARRDVWQHIEARAREALA